MMTPKLVDDLIEVLERDRLKGLRYVQLSPDNFDYLFQVKNDCHSSVQGKSRKDIQGEAPAPQTFEGKRVSSNAAAKSDGVTYKGLLNPESNLQEPEPPLLNGSKDELRIIVSKCTRCGLCNTRNQTVFGGGPTQANLMFIGDRPSQEDDAKGIPFSDHAGDLLNKIIKAMQFSRDQVYVTNVVKCAPPSKRLPSKDEAITCLPYLQKEIELVNPKVIVLLGATPLKYLLNKRGIAEYRGQWFKLKNTDCIPTYHPSYLLRIPTAKRDVWNDMQQVMKRLRNEN